MIVAQHVGVAVLGLVLQRSRVVEGPGRGPALDLCVLLVEAAPAFQPNVLDELGQGHAGLRLSTEIKVIKSVRSIRRVGGQAIFPQSVCIKLVFASSYTAKHIFIQENH